MTLKETIKKYKNIQKCIEEGEDFDNSELIDVIESLFYLLKVNLQENEK